MLTLIVLYEKNLYLDGGNRTFDRGDYSFGVDFHSDLI